MTENNVQESTVRRALEVQQIYLQHKKRHLPNLYIYHNYVYPKFFISERTFYRYLAMNAKKLVRQFKLE